MRTDLFILVNFNPSRAFLFRTFLRDVLVDGGEFSVEESLDMRPDLVGFCPREGLQHTFTPAGGGKKKDVKSGNFLSSSISSL